MWGTGPQNEATSDLVFAAKLRLNEGFWDLPPGSVLDPLKGDALGQGSGEKRDPNDAHDAFRPRAQDPHDVFLFGLGLGSGRTCVCIFTQKNATGQLWACYGHGVSWRGRQREREREMCVYIYIEKLYNIQIYIYTHMYIYIYMYIPIYIYKHEGVQAAVNHRDQNWDRTLEISAHGGCSTKGPRGL